MPKSNLSSTFLALNLCNPLNTWIITKKEKKLGSAHKLSPGSWRYKIIFRYLPSNGFRPLPLHHRYMAGTSIQVNLLSVAMLTLPSLGLYRYHSACIVQLQKAAKLLDSGAVRATRFLWRYPTARLLLLFYLVRFSFSLCPKKMSSLLTDSESNRKCIFRYLYTFSWCIYCTVYRYVRFACCLHISAS